VPFFQCGWLTKYQWQSVKRSVFGNPGRAVQANPLGGKMKLFLVMLFAAFAAFAAVPQSEEDFEAAMKKILPTQGSLRKAIEAKDAEAVKKDAAALEAIFKTSEDFWKKRGTDDAAEWSLTGKMAASDIAKLAGSGEWEKIPDEQKKIQSTCMACHTAHREKLPEGGYKIK